MLQRYVQELAQVYINILADAEYAFPSLSADFKRDRNRLECAVKDRGLHLFVADLPALGKHFDRCLSLGQYVPSGLPLSKGISRRVKIPKFLRGLYLLVFDSDGSLKGVPNGLAITFLRTVFYCAKKVTVSCSRHDIAASVADFIATDQELPEPSKFWEVPCSTLEVPNETSFGTSERYRRRARDKWKHLSADPVPESPLLRVQNGDVCSLGRGTDRLLLENLDLVSGILVSELGSFDPEISDFKHGPGSVSDVPKGESKYTWKTWDERQEQLFPVARYGFTNYGDWAHANKLQLAGALRSEVLPPSDEPWSKLVAVPKKHNKPRLIASEPASKQWCQQCVKHFMYERVESTLVGCFIHFEDQTRNQELARLGSMGLGLATIDLSEASDRVSTLAVECAFRSNKSLLHALQATRTLYLRQDLNTGLPEIYKLRKFSTMGNACTFPVESLIFLIAALASCLTQAGVRATRKRILDYVGIVAVFGDDCIVPEDSREIFVRCLEILDFKVNEDKSFWTGRFRESCGYDAFNGQNVTPVYWHAPYDESPASLVRRVDCANNFYSKFFVNTSAFLARTITKWNIPLVRFGSGTLGIQSFVVPSDQRFKQRRNEALQRDELLVPVPIGRVHKASCLGHERLLQYFTEDPDPMTNWQSGVTARPEVKIRHRWQPKTDYA
jgi:hypothetical protein